MELQEIRDLKQRLLQAKLKAVAFDNKIALEVINPQLNEAKKQEFQKLREQERQTKKADLKNNSPFTKGIRKLTQKILEEAYPEIKFAHLHTIFQKFLEEEKTFCIGRTVVGELRVREDRKGEVVVGYDFSHYQIKAFAFNFHYSKGSLDDFLKSITVFHVKDGEYNSLRGTVYSDPVRYKAIEIIKDFFSVLQQAISEK